MSVQRRYTSADLDRLPEIEGIRYEIIDGVLHVSKAPKLEHQYVCLELGAELHTWSKKAGTGRAYGAPGLVFDDDDDDDVIPDLIWISRERLRVGRDASGHITVGPEVAIEVLSPGSANERRDREDKLQLYSRRGVDEYWIVDWRQHRVEVFRRTGGDLKLAATLGDNDTLTSPLLPGFEVRVASLWEPA
jgi:Uma2 family endonuclease